MEQAINGVLYEHTTDGSLVRERDQKTHYPIQKQPKTTKNGVMETPSVITLTAGTDYIDPWNSYVQFNLTGYAASLQGMQLTGGIISLIQNVVLRDKWGNEIERCDNVNRCSTTLLRGQYGDAWLDNSAGEFAVDEALKSSSFSRVTETAGDLTLPQETTVAPIKAHIPLPLLLGLFRTTPLLPPQLMDGLEIWIYWVDVEESFKVLLTPTEPFSWSYIPLASAASTLNIYDGKPFSSYTISDLELITDNYFLEHGLHDMINKEYTATGLPLKFYSWGWDSTVTSSPDLTSAKHLLAPIRKTYTNATKVLSLSRVIPHPNTSISADATYLGLRGTINQFYNTHSQQAFKAPSTDYMQRNGRIFPKSPTNTLSKSIYYWKQAMGVNRFYVQPFSNDLVTAWKAGGLGPTWMKTLTRNPNIAPNVSTGLMGSSAKVLSGLRIDGTNPIDCFYTLPILTAGDITQLGSVSTDAVQKADVENPVDMKCRLDTWVEHVRYVHIKQDGNRVFA